MTYKAYKYRIFPNTIQVELIIKTFGCTRLVFNKALDKWNTDYTNGINTNKSSLSSDLTKLKKELEFLKEVDSIALQSSIFELHSAFNMFFKKEI